jgi:hypothetical protein
MFESFGHFAVTIVLLLLLLLAALWTRKEAYKQTAIENQ